MIGLKIAGLANGRLIGKVLIGLNGVHLAILIFWKFYKGKRNLIEQSMENS